MHNKATLPTVPVITKNVSDVVINNASNNNANQLANDNNMLSMNEKVTTSTLNSFLPSSSSTPPSGIRLPYDAIPTATNTINIYTNPLKDSSIQQHYCCPYPYQRHYARLYHHYIFNNNSNIGYYYYSSPTPLSTTTFFLDSTSGINNDGVIRGYDSMMYSTSNNESYTYQQQQQLQPQSINPMLLFDGDHNHQYHPCGLWNNIDTSVDDNNFISSNSNFDINTVLFPYNDTAIDIPMYAHCKNVLTTRNTGCTFPTTAAADGINDSSDELSSGSFSTSSTNETITDEGEGSFMTAKKKQTSSSTVTSPYAKKKKRPNISPVTVLRGQFIPGLQKSRRTKTSYDPKTSYRLNVLFFETFGKGHKPTKFQRYKIQRKTGISSRRLTYWLSNHKRRFNAELKAFHRLVLEKKIGGYNDFIEYCKINDVPELRRDDQKDDYNSDHCVLEMGQHKCTGSGPTSNDDDDENDIESSDDDYNDNDTISNGSLLSDNDYANNKNITR